MHILASSIELSSGIALKEPSGCNETVKHIEAFIIHTHFILVADHLPDASHT